MVRGGRPYAPTSLAEFVVPPEVPEAVERLRAADFLTIVVTNQPDVATGKQTLAVLTDMHELLRRAVSLDDIKACCHTDADACDCRKPKPGMLISAAREHDIDLARSYMVGDRWRDVAAGQAAGCMTVFIDYGYDEPRPTNPDAIVTSLPQAADWILRREGMRI